MAPAGALLAVWLIVAPRTPDLAAQVYRVDLFRSLGPAIWDEHWYAGHGLPGYSLLFPPLGSFLGVRLVGALAVLVSVLLFDRIARALFGSSARWPTACFAVAAVGDLWIGRIAFALGVSFALAAALALVRDRPVPAAVLAAACAAASPVAGVLLGLAGLSISVHQRSARAVLLLGIPPAAVVLGLAVLFPEGGWEPYPIRSFAATAVVVIAFLCALPPAERGLRTAAIVYLAACLACLAIHSPMGSNIERYAVLLAGPLLLGAVLSSRARAREHGGEGPPGARPPAVAVAVLILIAVWVVWGPVRETLAVAGSQDTSAAYYVPVERFIAAVPDGPVRVEVPLTRSHWEAALLAPSVSLARGWEKQLETRYAHPLLSPGPAAASYRAWLSEQAVSYVALPDASLDSTSMQEGRLIRGGLPYLRLVFASRHWRIYRVLGATPILTGPGRLQSLGHDSFTVRAHAAGRLLVRVHFTPYWTVTAGRGCVQEAPGGWTEVVLGGPGTVTVAARFSFARAFSGTGSCPGVDRRSRESAPTSG
ncbi:MAG TPA: hypothetical protein VKG62_06930 [Solirubrobacteraceae bacterium]|nr:hypothetical protein [Solirubrobacteraceae bacterium]